MDLGHTYAGEEYYSDDFDEFSSDDDYIEEEININNQTRLTAKAGEKEMQEVVEQYK